MIGEVSAGLDLLLARFSPGRVRFHTDHHLAIVQKLSIGAIPNHLAAANVGTMDARISEHTGLMRQIGRTLAQNLAVDLFLRPAPGPYAVAVEDAVNVVQLYPRVHPH